KLADDPVPATVTGDPDPATVVTFAASMGAAVLTAGCCPEGNGACGASLRSRLPPSTTHRLVPSAAMSCGPPYNQASVPTPSTEPLGQPPPTSRMVPSALV